MQSNEISPINYTSIRNFYRILNFSSFNNLNFDKKEIIDSTLPEWSRIFDAHSSGYLSKMTLVAERLTTSPQKYGLSNGDEQAYFYIMLIDPNFFMLEATEVARTQEELKELCIKNFGFYDKVMIHLEKKCNEKFKIYDDIWALDRIKK